MDSLRPQTSHEQGNKKFVTSYFQNSRLHFIGSWKARYQELLREKFLEISPRKKIKRKRQRLGTIRWVLHVDMDCFFASIAIRDDPTLSSQTPVAICWNKQGGNSEISSCNYKARSFGVKAGIFLSSAKKLCPNLQTRGFEFTKYENAAERMYECLFRLSSNVKGVSCDEAFVDVTQLVDSEQGALSLVRDLRAEILNQTGCTASVGISHNMLLAKMATNRAKPNGVYYYPIKGSEELLAPLPLRELPGVGRQTEKKVLAKFPLFKTVGDLQRVSLDELQALLGTATGKNLFNLCRGWEKDKDSHTNFGETDRKSIGAQASYGVRMKTLLEVHDFLKILCVTLQDRVKKDFPKGGNRLSLRIWKAKPDNESRMKGTIGHGNCENLHRSVRLGRFVCNAKDLAAQAIKLFENFDCAPAEVRGVGITLSEFEISEDYTNQPRLRFKQKDPVPVSESESENSENEKDEIEENELLVFIRQAFDAKCSYPRCKVHSSCGHCERIQMEKLQEAQVRLFQVATMLKREKALALVRKSALLSGSGSGTGSGSSRANSDFWAKVIAGLSHEFQKTVLV